MGEDEAGRFGRRFPRADTSTVMTWKADGDKEGLMEGNLIVGSKGVREAEACVGSGCRFSVYATTPIFLCMKMLQTHVLSHLSIYYMRADTFGVCVCVCVS